MIIQWESENMAWGFYFHLGWKSFFIAFTIAGVDVEFHIYNVRDIVYDSSTSIIEGEKG